MKINSKQMLNELGQPILHKTPCYGQYGDDRVLIGLSGGINSMAVLCDLIESGVKPKELHLYYAHFAEHSPDTFQFVADGIRYAKKHFDNVQVKITSNSIIKYFKEQNLIPHPIKEILLQFDVEPSLFL